MSFEKEKRIVHDLRKLSEDKSTQYEMVNQHAALPSLILFLHHQNQEIVKDSLEALKNLSECVANRSVMNKEPGLIDSLQALVVPNSHSQTSFLASTILKTLSTPTSNASRPLGTLNNNKSSTPTKTQNATLTSFNSSLRPGTGLRGEASKPLFNSQNAKANKTIILQIDYNSDVSGKKSSALKNQDQSKRTYVEDALLSVRGVVSFTYDSSTQRFVVRVRKEIEVEVLFDAILDIDDEINVAQVVKTPDGKEKLIYPDEEEEDEENDIENQNPNKTPISNKNNNNDDDAKKEANRKQPETAEESGYLDDEYLDEEIDDEKKKKSAVTMQGYDFDADDKNKTNGGGWLGYIVKSFWGN
jgi:hypothetical protein